MRNLGHPACTEWWEQLCEEQSVARGVLHLSALRENSKYFSWFFLLSLSSVTKDIAVTIAALCSSKNKLSSSWGFSRWFVTVS